MSISLRTLKGVGEKTEKLFAKIGVTDMESLLSYIHVIMMRMRSLLRSGLWKRELLWRFLWRL